VNWLGYKQVTVKSIVVDAVDIRRRVAMQHVADLAESIRENGGEAIHAPTIRAGSSAILCGRDRVAASIVNKTKKIWVHVVECGDDEAKSLELSENIYRRPIDKESRAQMVTALVKLKEQQIRAIDEAKRQAGEEISDAPQNSPKARARKEVARAAGISPAAVKKHEQRAMTEPGTVSPAQTAQPSEITLPEGFETFGLTVPWNDADAIVNTAEWLADFETATRKILRDLTEIEKLGVYAISAAHIQVIRERAQLLGHAVRDAMPAGLCFYCKGQLELVEACAGCGGTGVGGRHGGDSAPADLKRTDLVFVSRNGDVVPLNGDVVPLNGDAPPAAKKGKRGSKQIHVEVVDEVGAAPRELTLEPDADVGI
jgi:hypothetical protein